MHKEIRIKYARISDPQTITQVNIEEFKKLGLDIHHNEVDEIIDDHDKEERVMKIRSVKYFT